MIYLDYYLKDNMLQFNCGFILFQPALTMLLILSMLLKFFLLIIIIDK